MMRVRFGCGHVVEASRVDSGVCPQCGDTRVVTVKAPAPRFTGLCTGPCATYAQLEAQPVRLTQETA